jgi:hypothetical protein
MLIPRKYVEGEREGEQNWQRDRKERLREIGKRDLKR